MCDLFGGNGGQAAAQQQANMLQQQQSYRTHQIKQDTNAVDTAFSPFNDDYYKNYTKAYEDTQNPQLDWQYGRAQGTLESNLADTDRLEGSTGARALGDLYQTYAGARSGIANSAMDATNNLRATVDNAKTGLYGLAEQATDPLTMEREAQAQSGALVAPQSYPTLGNVFGDVLSPVASGLKTSNASMNPGSIASAFQAPPVSGNGSGVFT